jgi:hypothetical protein
MVNADFAEWATSYSGCDGGALAGKVWLCGIEYGANNPQPNDPAYSAVNVPCFVGCPHYDRKDFLRYQYNWKAIKLLAAYYGTDVTDYKSFFQSQNCFGKNSDSFKLNLYPLGFKNTSAQHWPPWLFDRIGFQNKKEYLDWCSVYRFSAIRTWASKHTPEVVICTGKQYLTEFQKAFGGSGAEVRTTEAAGKLINYFVTNNGKTLVVVVNFLGGRYGLSSDRQITETGRKVAELSKERLSFLQQSN